MAVAELQLRELWTHRAFPEVVEVCIEAEVLVIGSLSLCLSLFELLGLITFGSQALDLLCQFYEQELQARRQSLYASFADGCRHAGISRQC